MALWSIDRTSLDTPSTGLPNNNLTDRIANPSMLNASNLPFGRLIDVVTNFNWTYSPRPTSREEVPLVKLIERRLLTNALIAQLKYSIGTTANTLEEIATQLQARAAAAGGNDTIKSLLALVAQDASNLATVGEGIAQRVLPGDENATLQTSSYLQPYRNLYITKPTGWRYYLPYFENTWEGLQNQFGSTGASNLIGNITQGAADLATGVTEIAATIQRPFDITYVERSKFYNYADDGEDITVTFPLINTGSATYDDVINNWQLIYLLLFQNRPGKTSINTVEQPVLYEVEIPGIKFFPFAYMSNISVDFQGARRRMVLNIPYTEVQTSVDETVGEGRDVTRILNAYSFDAIIPDAYIVKLTLHGLNTTTRNFMYHMLTNQRVLEATEAAVGPIPGTEE